jgi:hypothetical protein
VRVDITHGGVYQYVSTGSESMSSAQPSMLSDAQSVTLGADAMNLARCGRSRAAVAPATHGGEHADAERPSKTSHSGRNHPWECVSICVNRQRKHEQGAAFDAQ